MLQFTEPLTKGVLKVGSELLLQKYKTSKAIGFYTFIQSMHIEIELFVDNTPIILKPNHIISLTPDQYFSVIHSGPCKVYQFNRDFYCIKDHDREVNCMGILFHSDTQSPTVLLDIKEVTKIDLIYNDVLEEFENEDSVQSEMLQVLLKNLIIRITRLIKTQHQSQLKNTSPRNELHRQFNILVETHFRSAHQVSFYADKLCKSAKTLSNSFSTSDTTPLQIIHDRIILEIKRLLMYSELSLKEIAFELGFVDAANLSKFFKKRIGQSPLNFRKSTISKKRKN